MKNCNIYFKIEPIMDEMVPSVEGSLFCIGHSFPEGT